MKIHALNITAKIPLTKPINGTVTAIAELVAPCVAELVDAVVVGCRVGEEDVATVELALAEIDEVELNTKSAATPPVGGLSGVTLKFVNDAPYLKLSNELFAYSHSTY